MENKENCIEFFTGDKVATLSLTSRRYISRIKKLRENYPDDINYVENKDGSICAKIPVSFVKLIGPRQLTDEQKEAASQRLKRIVNKRKGD